MCTKVTFMKRLVLLLVLCSFITVNYAQNKDTLTKPFKRFSVSDFTLTLSYFGGKVNTNGFADAEYISGYPSTIPQDSGAGFGRWYNENTHLTAAANFKINRKTPAKFHHYVGIGLTFSQGSGFQLQNNTSYRETIDTLTSTSSPYYALVDTFSRRSRFSTIETNNLLVNLSYRISTNPARRVSGYATANLGIGGAVSSSQFEFDYINSGLIMSELINPADTTNWQPQYNNYFGTNYLGANNQFSGFSSDVAKPFILRPYLAAGINFRLARKVNVLKHLSFNLEYRFGGQVLFIKERTYSGFSSGMAIGLRYTLSAFKKVKS